MSNLDPVPATPEEAVQPDPGLPVEDEESGLVAYARRELELAGLFDADSDYGGMLGEAALEIIRVFARQGHSGFSAGMTTDIVTRLMRYEPLTALAYEPDQWIQHADDVWQHKRKPDVFSDDGGLTHYCLADLESGDIDDEAT